MTSTSESRVSKIATIVIGAAAVIMLGMTVYDRIIVPRFKPKRFVVVGEDRLLDHEGRMDSRRLLEWGRAGHRMGPADAPVRIVEFGNALCSFCAKLHFILDTLRARYPDQLSVTWLHYVPSGGGSTISAKAFGMALECAATQEKFQEYLSATYSAQRRLGTRSQLASLAVSAGIADTARFGSCIDLEETAPKVEAESEEARSLGFQGTPTWFLNGRAILGTPSLEAIDSAIVKELRRK